MPTFSPAHAAASTPGSSPEAITVRIPAAAPISAATTFERIPPDHFDVVVVDEFHHAEAPTYRCLLDHLAPRELLGLTATPERTDGTDVRAQFGGRSAYELRLWDALGADLLVPFHYFGVHDDVDLRGVEWKRGTYDAAALDNVYTGNDARARKVVRETVEGPGPDRFLAPEIEHVVRAVASGAVLAAAAAAAGPLT